MAAILLNKLKRLDNYIMRRRKIAKIYQKAERYKSYFTCERNIINIHFMFMLLLQKKR